MSTPADTAEFTRLLEIFDAKRRFEEMFAAHLARYLGDRVVVLSPRTCSVKQILEVPLPRPRQIYAPEFVELRHQILDIIKGENML